MKSLVNPQDPFEMNWLGEHTEWGTVRTVDGITVSKGRKLGNNIIKEQYVFRNDTNREIFLREGDLAIYTPFRDSYEDVQTCLEARCHTHVWCGGEVSYVCALRMGDVEPHMGLCLTSGSLCSYSFDREGKRGPHDRGDLLLNVTPRVVKPGESIDIEWVIFWHKGKHDFYKVISIDKQRTTQIQSYNLHGTLNRNGTYRKASMEIPIASLPTRIVSLDFVPNKANTVELYMDGGWQFSFRIHNAEKKVVPSLKFDIQIVGMPTTIITINCLWK